MFETVEMKWIWQELMSLQVDGEENLAEDLTVPIGFDLTISPSPVVRECLFPKGTPASQAVQWVTNEYAGGRIEDLLDLPSLRKPDGPCVATTKAVGDLLRQG